MEFYANTKTLGEQYFTPLEFIRPFVKQRPHNNCNYRGKINKIINISSGYLS